MIKTYTFKGDEVIGNFVMTALNEKGYEHVNEVAEADVVFVHCYHTGAIEDTYFDDNGLVKEARPETFLINLSASTPSLAREVSAVSAVNDLRCIEAPLALRDPFASGVFDDHANIVAYLGGEAQDCAAVKECVESLAGNVVEAGDCGSAQLAKVCTTIRQASSIVATVEELALCHNLQHDSAEHLSGAFPLFASDDELLKLARSVDANAFAGGYSNALLMSDVVAAMTAADDAGLILPQLEAAMHILELFGVIGGADLSVAALPLLYRDEEEGEAAGLDWSRAQNFYQGLDEDHGAPYEEAYGDEDEFDFGDDIDYYSN